MRCLTDATLQPLLGREALRLQHCVNVRDCQHRGCARIRPQMVGHEPILQQQVCTVRRPAPREEGHLQRLVLAVYSAVLGFAGWMLHVNTDLQTADVLWSFEHKW